MPIRINELVIQVKVDSSKNQQHEDIKDKQAYVPFHMTQQPLSPWYYDDLHLLENPQTR